MNRIAFAHTASACLHGIALLLGAFAYVTRDVVFDEQDRIGILRDLTVASSLEGSDSTFGDANEDEPGEADERESASPIDRHERGSSGARSLEKVGAVPHAIPPQASRGERGLDPATFGIIGLLESARDRNSYRGAAGFADRGDDAAHLGDGSRFFESDFGGSTGGLALSTAGEGSGGSGRGIDQKGVRGTCGENCNGSGAGRGRLAARGHRVVLAAVRCGFAVDLEHDDKTKRPCMGTAVSGRLPPETVQRIVRQNFGRFRACYETGLARNPSLEGRVTLKFVIDSDGSVSFAEDGGSDLADPSVVACVVRAIGTVSFPAPTGGIVTVVYPLTFSSS